MIARMIVSSVIVISLLDPVPAITAHLSTQTQTTPDSQVEKIKSQIAEIGAGEVVTVIHNNGEKYIGRITRIGDAEFEMTDLHRGTIYTLSYHEVKQVERGIDLGFTKILTAENPSAQTASSSQIEGIKLLVRDLGIGTYVTVTLINGRKVRGLITRIGDTEFEVSDVDRHRQMAFTIQYGEVRRVESGLKSYRTWWIIGAASIIAVPLIIYLLTRPSFEGFPK